MNNSNTLSVTQDGLNEYTANMDDPYYQPVWYKKDGLQEGQWLEINTFCHLYYNFVNAKRDDCLTCADAFIERTRLDEVQMHKENMAFLSLIGPEQVREYINIFPEYLRQSILKML